MAKDPAVLWYTSDFLTGTAHFKDDELGFYTRLLAYQHQQGRLSIDFVKRACKGNFARKWEAVKDKFVMDENNLLYNERMEAEMARRKKNSDRQSERVKKRWDGYHGNTAVIQELGNTFLETENETVTEKGIGVPGEGEKWISKPGADEHALLLSDYDASMTIEFIHRLKKTLLTQAQVNEYWQAFKLLNFTGEKYYQSPSACTQHFRNWLKTQDYGTHKRPIASGNSKPGTSDARIQAAKNW